METEDKRPKAILLNIQSFKTEEKSSEVKSQLKSDTDKGWKTLRKTKYSPKVLNRRRHRLLRD